MFHKFRQNENLSEFCKGGVAVKQQYDNGMTTRRAIVEAGKELYYQKGFHATSYHDLCEMAHIDRSTFYYHFRSKEVLRYEVEWEFLTWDKRIAEKYCMDARYHYLVAMAMIWQQCGFDAKLRRFQRECCVDFPVFTGKKDVSYFYYTASKALWGAFLDWKNLPTLAFATNYGYLISCLLMLCDHPETYEPWELFSHCVRCCCMILGMPEAQIAEILRNIKTYLDTIPEEELHSF